MSGLIFQASAAEMFAYSTNMNEATIYNDNAIYIYNIYVFIHVLLLSFVIVLTVLYNIYTEVVPKFGTPFRTFHPAV